MTDRLRRALYGTEDVFAGYVPSLPLDLQGWGAESPAFDVILKDVAPRTILEIGTWKGASAARMAELAPEASICCVDTWLGQIEFMDADSEWSGILGRRFGYPDVYEQFIANMHRLGLLDRVTPIAQTSPLACKWLLKHGFRFDLIYVDGSHEYEDVVVDVRNARALLADGGRVFGDDYEWDGPGRMLKENPHWILHDKWILKP